MIHAEAAIEEIKSGDHIFIHGAAATPQTLINFLIKRSAELENVTLYHLHTEGPIPYVDSKYKRAFAVRNLFVGSNVRRFIDFERIDYIPCFLSEMPNLFRSKKIKLDWAFIQTSAPDRHGFVSLGTSVDIAKAASLSATKVVAEINQQMPRTFGDGQLNLSQLYASIKTDHSIFESKNKPLSGIDVQIGKNVASLIEDGSCLQLGIGSIPNAVLSQLGGLKNLGLHSEMCSDGVLPLIQSGVLNNSCKKVHQGKSISSFLIGTKELYDHVHDNPNFFLLEADFVNNPRVISKNPKMVSVNSAVEVDLTGQVCADSIGPKIISGVGGQIDFIRGASLSENGKPILAITSRTSKNTSRIVPFLKEGAGVVTTRSHTHFVVTEFGIADLYGKSIGERAKALISIAHPEDRDLLLSQWKKLYV